jgi:hypothetical protein
MPYITRTTQIRNILNLLQFLESKTKLSFHRVYNIKQECANDTGNCTAKVM